MPSVADSLDLTRLRAAYLARRLRPSDVVAQVLERIARRGDDKVWISVTPQARLLTLAEHLEQRDPSELPLYGVPFAIKDNIDCTGLVTTAACPDFAYTPQANAAVVQRLIDAGAIPIGKTNLDQFATGLVGTRSPYGAPSSVFDARYISGGSSAGSAVAVAAGLVSFALGTDTAGSGRVPAAFNNIVGLKPTRGLLSTRGVVPACRSLDCVSVFALTVDDAQAVLGVAQGFDAADPFSRANARKASEIPERFVFAVPREQELEFFGDEQSRAMFTAAVAALRQLGATPVEIDYCPFLETARLLYDGPWVAERWLVARELLARKPDALLPVTRKVIEAGAKPSAADAYAAYYRLKELQRLTAAMWDKVAVLVTPTAATIYSHQQIEAEPIALNSRLGYYTNFVNLLDLAALAIPAGFRSDALPFGITLTAPAFHDRALCDLGMRLQRTLRLPLGATSVMPPERTIARSAPVEQDPTVRVAVCGAHMSGLPLNRELTTRGARLLRATRTSPNYRLFALEAFTPPRPGMVRMQGGAAIDLEVWEVPTTAFGSFVDGIPAPLGIGTVELEDGERVRGFLCEHYATVEAREITNLGGWRAYLATK